MNELDEVTVEGAPGYENFKAYLWDIFRSVDERGDLGIILGPAWGDITVIPMKYVTYVTGS
jgi:hypothetical protein